MRSLPACSRQRRVRQVAVGKACVPYFRAEVAITRNAVDQRYVEQKRFRALRQRACSRKACSFQRGFLQVYVRTVAVLQKRGLMNAALSAQCR